MPASLEHLDPDFRRVYSRLLEECRAEGFPMTPFFTVRTPQKQAELWRQSRSTREINAGVEWLRAAGAPHLAEIVVSAGPQFGSWATNAVPGNSWHQWGEAGDAAAVVDGSISWDTIKGERGGPGDAYYAFYARRAAELDLTSLSRIGDWVHVQKRRESSPARIRSWAEIDDAMRRRFPPS